MLTIRPFSGGDLHFCNVLLRGHKNEQRNIVPCPKNNAAADFKGPVKIELLKGAGLLHFRVVLNLIMKAKLSTKFFI